MSWFQTHLVLDNMAWPFTTNKWLLINLIKFRDYNITEIPYPYSLRNTKWVLWDLFEGQKNKILSLDCSLYLRQIISCIVILVYELITFSIQLYTSEHVSSETSFSWLVTNRTWESRRLVFEFFSFLALFQTSVGYPTNPFK